MFKKTITYEDYNGKERTEDFYFNLNEAEIMEMELTADGGLVETIQRIIAAQDQASIIKIFKDFVLKAYGVKSADGRQFNKDDQIRKDFEHSKAYSIIFMELATDADKAQEFVNGLMPGDLAKKAAETPVLATVNN